LADLLPKYMLK